MKDEHCLNIPDDTGQAACLPKANDRCRPGNRVGLGPIAATEFSTGFGVLLLFIAVFFALPLFGGESAPEEHLSDPVLFQLQWMPQSQFAGYIVAKEKGFFRKRGVTNLRFQWGDGDRPTLGQLVSGKADFATSWLPAAMREREQGGDLVCLAQIFKSSSLVLVVHRGSGIRALDDLRDKKMLVWAGDAGEMVTAFLKRHGVKIDPVPSSTSLYPFIHRLVPAAACMRYNEYYRILEGGIPEKSLLQIVPPTMGFDYPEDGIYCTAATRERRPRLCRAVVDASLEGWKYALDPENEREVVRLVMEYSDQTREQITNANLERHMLRRLRESIPPGMTARQAEELSREDYERTARLLREYELAVSPPPYEEFYRPVPQEFLKN